MWKNMRKWLTAGGCSALILLGAGAGKLTASGEETDWDVEAPHAVLMEVSTGTILAEKDADTPVHPASVTKVMTLLLIMEALEQGRISLEDQVVTSTYARSMGGSQVFLEEGEKQTVKTMIKCIVIASGNDAAVAMAEHLEGSEEAFVRKMNERAAELGMEHTHFTDCCGLTDSEEHYTTARDVALMSRELLYCYPEITRYSSIWMEDIIHETRRGSIPFTLTNTNKLLRSYEGCDGLKTGSTLRAKYCLSATAVRGGIRLISVIMTAPDSKTRFRNAASLLDYGFGICRLYRDVHEDLLDPLRVKGGQSETVGAVYEEEFTYLSTKTEDFNGITSELSMPETVKAPVEEGQELGKRVYYLEGKEIGSTRILAAEAVEQADYRYCLGQIWKAFGL